MQQHGDAEFINLLNHIRVADLDNCDLEILKSGFISTNRVNYPRDALHLQQHTTLPCCSQTSMSCIVLKQFIFCQKIPHQQTLLKFLIATKVKQEG